MEKPPVDWAARYAHGDTPWDKGEPHPALPSLLSIHDGLFTADQDVILPGCGYGYDANLIAEQARSVTALDIASAPIERAKELYPAANIHWQVADFFTWHQSHPQAYDTILEHTCYCAIPLDQRDDYVTAAAGLLKPHGLLCGIFFLNPDHAPEDGPPFGVTREELNQRFAPCFDLIWDLPPSATYEGRENRETIMLWRRKR